MLYWFSTLVRVKLGHTIHTGQMNMKDLARVATAIIRAHLNERIALNHESIKFSDAPVPIQSGLLVHVN